MRHTLQSAFFLVCFIGHFVIQYPRRPIFPVAEKYLEALNIAAVLGYFSSNHLSERAAQRRGIFKSCLMKMFCMNGSVCLCMCWCVRVCVCVCLYLCVRVSRCTGEHTYFLQSLYKGRPILEAWIEWLNPCRLTTTKHISLLYVELVVLN